MKNNVEFTFTIEVKVSRKHYLLNILFWEIMLICWQNTWKYDINLNIVINSKDKGNINSHMLFNYKAFIVLCWLIGGKKWHIYYHLES